MCFVIMELFTNLSPNGTTEHFPISRESKNNTYVVYYIKRGGGHIWSSGCGEFFYHESYYDERVVMTIYGFKYFL